MLLALLALRRDFYLSSDVSGLTGPAFVTISRLFELALDVFAMVYLASRCREDKELCRFGLRLYCTIGVAGCIWGWIIMIFFTLRGIPHRITGFNNEAGPFGVYLITVIMAILAARQKHWIKRSTFIAVMPFLIATLIGSKSKAALIEIAVFVLVIAMLKMKPVKALLVTLSVSTAILILFQILNLSAPMAAYVKLSDQYRLGSLARPTDGNYVMGRVAGLFLTPKMIAAHPLTGIGLGNYPLVRDDPQYRQGSAIISTAQDSPSLGPLDYLVEIGVPLFLYLTWIQIMPVVMLLRRGASMGTVALSLSMPISLWFGAHLNMTYPWIAGAFAMALFYSDHSAVGRAFSPLDTRSTALATS